MHLVLRKPASAGAILRVAAALLVAETVLHELRYAVAPITQAHQHGAHLPFAGPLLAVLSAAALAIALLGAATGPQAGNWRGPRLSTVWGLSSVAVLAMFASQEAVETVVSHHHPGLATAVSDGGWVAVPLAALLGGAVALAVGARRALLLAPRPGAHMLADVHRWLVNVSPSTTTPQTHHARSHCASGRSRGRAPPNANALGTPAPA